jgi:probable HAF family extracellular repeat protein
MFESLRFVGLRGLRAAALLGLLAASFMPLQLFAQPPAMHHHYKLVDIGTFGGPQSYLIDTGILVNGAALNNNGALTGYADTSIADPVPAACLFQDCFVSYAFRWQDGVMTKLGSLRRGWSGAPVWTSTNGLTVGFSENGEIDPLTGLPEVRAVLWENGGVTDLGTLPEGGYESAATAVNSRGQVVGYAQNLIPDSNSWTQYINYLPPSTQVRAFLWEGGVMQDLGTLGGTDALAALINESGQVVGWSYTSTTQPGACSPLASGSFIWDREKGMRNVGSFGGTCTFAYGLNNNGQVVGYSNLPGDLYSRAFRSQDGVIQDLGGSLGGISTFAFAANEAGQAVGGAFVSNEPQAYFHATIWKRVGQITDIGTVDDDACSNATDINARGQVVGGSLSEFNCLNNGDFSRAFLWENGGIVDLNALIPPGSPLYLVYPDTINDRGEIAGNGVDASGNDHAFLLIPCDEKHADVEGCDYSLVDAATAAALYRPSFAVNAAAARQAEPSPPSAMARVRSLMTKRTR